MIKSLRAFLTLAVVLLPTFLMAQVETVTVKDLNTYPETPESVDDIMNHPYIVSEDTVKFTAVVVSYPKSSGNASFTADEEFSEGGSISRIHIFVVDTTALTAGKEGMYMQIVESGGSNPGDDDFAYFLEELSVGDVVDFVGVLGGFEGAIQFDVTQWDIDPNTNANVIGNVEDDEFTKFAPLLDPITGVTVDMLNQDNGDGTSYINYANYEKYANAFVEIEQAPVIARDAFDGSGSVIERPNWVIAQNSASMYMYDISLRYRNDKDIYRSSYNYRREAGEDGPFIPPAVGSTVRVQGFMNVDDFAGAIGRITAGEAALKFVPMEDGVLWFNDQRFVNGEDGFEWPDHVEVLGIAPTLSNFVQTPESGYTSSTEVEISIDAVGVEQPDASTSTVDSVIVIYETPAGTTRLELTASGDTYTGTLPSFPNLTPVNYYIEAYDNNGLIGRFPEFGSNGFFVIDGAISSFQDIQITPDEGEGPSVLVGSEYAMDIDALVVSDAAEDGVIIAHDGNSEWDGIFLSPSTDTNTLAKGDSINITLGTVQESEDGLTYLTNLTYTVLNSGNDIEPAIPVLTTNEYIAAQDGDVIESYEGMLIKLENVTLVDYAGFGEFTIASAGEEVIYVNDDFSEDGIGETDIPSDLDDHLRLGTEIDAFYGIIFTSFGFPKVQPRTLADIQAENFTMPVLELDLTSPEDSASVVVETEIVVEWEESEDYDGEDVTYEWVLYNAADTSEVVAVPSDDESSAAQVTLSFATVDALLATAGLSVGESADFVWNVRISDGNDTLDVASANYVNNDNEKVYTKTYNYLTLERATEVSTDDKIGGTPLAYSLEQNYPNPFNPSTKIEFSLPEASKVTLTVFDMLGRKVATLVNENMIAGKHEVQFDASRLASGMYIYRIDAANFSSTRRMMLIK